MTAEEHAALLTRLRDGDEQAFTQVVTEWTPALRRFVTMYVKSSASVDEVVQETWLAFIRGIDTFRGDSSLRTWTISIAKNIARKYGVKESRSVPWSSLSDDERGPAEDQARFIGPGEPWSGHWTSLGAPLPWAPERMALSTEIRAVLREALSDLPDRQRTVVALRDIDGFTSDEVCELLTISPANQRVLLHRGRTQLRSALEAFATTGGTDD